jgi:hypothetical protein
MALMGKALNRKITMAAPMPAFDMMSTMARNKNTPRMKVSFLKIQ